MSMDMESYTKFSSSIQVAKQKIYVETKRYDDFILSNLPLETNIRPLYKNVIVL